MSIINTMLRDLDRRKGRPTGEGAAGDAVHAVKEAPPVSKGTAAVLAALVGATIAFLYWTPQGGQKPAAPIQAPPPPPVAAAPVAPPPPTPAPQPAPAPAAEAAPAKAEPVVAKAESPVPVKLEPARGMGPAASAVRLSALTPPPAAAPVPAATAAPAARPAKADAAVAAVPPARPAAPIITEGPANKPVAAKQMRTTPVAEAASLEQQGRVDDAKATLQRALLANPLDLASRQMLVRLMMDSGQTEQARTLLVEGQRLHPEQPALTMAAARMKAEAGDNGGAIELLEAGRAGARDDPQYHAMLAALLLRVQRYDDSVQHYLAALRTDPANPTWLVGAGVALENVGKTADAAEAYRRAEGAPNLSPDTARFLSERLARLKGAEPR